MSLQVSNKKRPRSCIFLCLVLVLSGCIVYCLASFVLRTRPIAPEVIPDDALTVGSGGPPPGSKALAKNFGVQSQNDLMWQALLSSNLIKEVIDELNVDASVHMTVTFGSTRVGFGNPIALQKAASAPTVQIEGNGLYTLVMMSPDVELREELAELSQYVHWLLMNIPNGDMSLAAQVLGYQEPKEQAPGQRFAFFLWKQPFFLGVPVWPRERFDVRWFQFTSGLENPVCALWFTSP